MLRGSFALDPHLGRLQDVVIPTVIASHPILFENCNIAPAITFSNFLHIVYLADGTTATATALWRKLIIVFVVVVDPRLSLGHGVLPRVSSSLCIITNLSQGMRVVRSLRPWRSGHSGGLAEKGREEVGDRPAESRYYLDTGYTTLNNVLWRRHDRRVQDASGIFWLVGGGKGRKATSSSL